VGEHGGFPVAFVVMAGGTDWAVLGPALAAAVGIGTITGAVITTYGGRGRERRKARSKALASLERSRSVAADCLWQKAPTTIPPHLPNSVPCA
jgi:hypothetical protein